MSELDPTLYSIAWFAPLEIEAQAAIHLLDRKHEGGFPMRRGDDFVFQAGEMCGHNVIIATFPAGQEYGTGSAAALAAQVKQFFPNLWFGLLVGVAAGLPNLSVKPPLDIRLGDVLVGLSTKDSAGLIAYELGKETDDGGFELLRFGKVLAETETVVRSAIGSIKLKAPRDADVIIPYYQTLRDKQHDKGTFEDPGQDQDILYDEHDDGSERVVRRAVRPSEQRTRVWYGSIGSGDKLMKNARKRNELRDKYNIIGLEMEAAGTMNRIPVGVIRGVCDYGDRHKNKEWQPYAAAMAAAYAKAVLSEIRPKVMIEDAPDEGASAKDAIARRRKEDDQSSILSWIAKTPYKKHYQTAKEGLLEGSGRWLLRNTTFKEWLDVEKSGLFWLHGKPGAGKTKLCAMLINHLIGQHEDVVYFFCSRNLNDPERQDPKSIMRALIHQLCLLPSANRFPVIVEEEYRRKESIGMTTAGLDFDECNELITGLLRGEGKVTIVIDGLDECYLRERSSLLASLKKYAKSSAKLVKVLISSRDDRDIVVRLKEMPNITIEAQLTKEDMKRFVEKELAQCINDKELLYGEVEPELEQKIATRLLCKADGMFLWVKLQLEFLCGLESNHQVLLRLGKLPTTLVEIYDQIFKDIENSASSLEAQKALAWILCSSEPLRPEQWATAVTWALGRKRALDDKIPIQLNADALRGMCRNLVIFDELQNNITYAHNSVREYLETKPQFSKLILETMAAESCLRFMIETILPRPSEMDYHFYRYAARYWIDHVKECGQQAPPELDEFLGTSDEPSWAYGEWKCAVASLARRDRVFDYADDIEDLTDPVLLAAFYGIRHTSIWKRGRFDPNRSDRRGRSLLALASQNGQKEIVELLLRNNAEVNPPPVFIDASTALAPYIARVSYLPFIPVDKSHPLFLAIQGGHTDVVSLLQDAGASFQNAKNVHVAAEYGSQGVLLRLLQEDPHQSYLDSLTLRYAATNKAHPEILETCLEKFPNSAIDGQLLEAVIENRGDYKDIIKKRLAPRITARVLLGVRRYRRTDVLKLLMDLVPNLQVTQDVIDALERDSPCGDDDVAAILRAQLPCNSVTSEALKAVFRVGYGAKDMLKALLKKRRSLSLDFDAKQSKTSLPSDSAEALFQKFFRGRVSEDLILAAAYNEREGLDLIKILFAKADRYNITEAIVAAVVQNAYGAVDILRYLLSKDQPVPVTEKVVVAAMQNQQHGFEIIDIFVSNNRYLPITESVVKAAAGNKVSGVKMIETLLSNDPSFQPSEAVLTAAVMSDEESVTILKRLLVQSAPSCITYQVLKAAAKNRSSGFEVVKLLFDKNPGIIVTESLVCAAAENPFQGLELVRFFLSQTHSISITEKLVVSASRNQVSGDSVIQALLTQPATVAIGVSAIRAAALTGEENWLRIFLAKADRQLLQRRFSPVILAAIENGDAGIMSACFDYGGAWGEQDEHGWNADLMAKYKRNEHIRLRIRDQVRCGVACPLYPTAWEPDDAPEISSNLTVLKIAGDNKSDIEVRANHPFAPIGLSYFEVDIIRLDQPKIPKPGLHISLGIGFVDEYFSYAPAYYTDDGYVRDYFLMREVDRYGKGDTVGYGLDWDNDEAFVTVNGERCNVGDGMEPIIFRRMFPYVVLYANSGSCTLRANFTGPFKYRRPVSLPKRSVR